MYLVVAYHGTGSREVVNDVGLIRNNLNNFLTTNKIRHIYYFQAIKDRQSGDILIVIQYENPMGIDSPYVDKEEYRDNQLGKDIDYWFYIRNNHRT